MLNSILLKKIKYVFPIFYNSLAESMLEIAL